MRSAPATTGRPSLACLFCRRRKIACPPPPPDSEDLTCQLVYSFVTLAADVHDTY
ncbi:uncharacterized protein EI90DRAFT_3070031 [Cantharellus anzutake]|uniref:uncharacterized protein n=1 Tax=Cantharellus anzutake TaxID=1750568 RepID=UPI0019044FB0|nr:uncharacterized protein EI90DRAFT_3070031 [Cantharellus anzutake]KAF8326639.1 hypothetical protein EI90DRAFT_3070031 [Cantharellus anzutake]